MSDIEILDVEFLTPARITMKQNGEQCVRQVSIDLASRKVYSENGEDLGDLIFQFLDSGNPPEDFFSPSDDIYEKVSEVYDEVQETRKAHVGEK